MDDPLRGHWDFADLDGSEERLQVQLAEESDDAGRAEVLTQLARVEGLRGDFERCERLLEESEGLAGSSDVAKVRIDLERGRKLRSSGDGAAALPLFEAAFERRYSLAIFVALAINRGQTLIEQGALTRCGRLGWECR